MNSWVVLLAIITSAASGYAEENVWEAGADYRVAFDAADEGTTSREEKTGVHDDFGVHVVNPGRLEFKKYIQQLPLPPVAKDCEEWEDSDSRIGMLLAVPGAASLFIGTRGEGEQQSGDANVRQIEKNYEVSSFTKGGSPLEGNLDVRLPASQMEAEMVCLQKLVGVPIQWPLVDGVPNYAEGIVEMVVRDVQFKREARLDGSGRQILTGAFVARLQMAEGRISMVFRQMKAHFWGIVGGVIGSALLMALTFMARRTKGAGRKVVGGISIITSTLSRIRDQRRSSRKPRVRTRAIRMLKRQPRQASGLAGDGQAKDSQQQPAQLPAATTGSGASTLVHKIP